MDIHEYQAKEILGTYEIPVRGAAASGRDRRSG